MGIQSLKGQDEPSPIQVEVQFFSYLRERTGQEVMHVKLPLNSSVEDLLNQIWSTFPHIKPLAPSTLCSVNLEYANRTDVLKNGDQVALFPPVQGG